MLLGAALVSVTFSDLVKEMPWEMSVYAPSRKRKLTCFLREKVSENDYNPFIMDEALTTVPTIPPRALFPLTQRVFEALLRERPIPKSLETLTVFGEQDAVAPLEYFPDLPNRFSEGWLRLKMLCIQHFFSRIARLISLQNSCST